MCLDISQLCHSPERNTENVLVCYAEDQECCARVASFF